MAFHGAAHLYNWFDWMTWKGWSELMKATGTDEIDNNMCATEALSTTSLT